MANTPRLELHLRNDLCRRDVEHSKRLRNGDEECVVGDVAAGADAAAVAESEGAGIGFGGVSWGEEEAGGVESVRGWVGGGIVCEPPRWKVMVSESSLCR